MDFSHSLTFRAAGLLIVALSLVAPGALDAGFNTARVQTVKIGPGNSEAKLDKANVSDPVPAIDITRMKQNFLYSSLTDAQIQAKVENMRRAIICAIELIKGENAKVGEGLEKLYKTNGICIGLAPRGYRVVAEIRPDGKTGFSTSERINVYPCLNSASSLTDINVFKIYDALSHEGLHAVQQVDFSPRPNLTQAKDIMCKEVDAHTGQVTRISAMIAVLRGLRDSGSVPASATGAAKEFGKALKAAGASTTTLNEWLKTLEADLKVQRNLVKFRSTYKKAAELALANDPNTEDVLRSLKRWGSWYRFFGKRREFGPITDYFLNPPPVIKQSGMLPPVVEGDAEFASHEPSTNSTVTYSLPGADTFSDGLLIDDRLYLAGVNIGTDEGIIYYCDLDPTTNQPTSAPIECLRDVALGGGPCLFEDPATSNLWCVNRYTGELYCAEDTNADTVPDILSARGYCTPPDLDFGVYDCAFIDTDTIACTSFPEETFRPAGYTLSTAIRNPSVNGTFAPSENFQPYTDVVVSPSCDANPLVEEYYLGVYGTPGTDYTVYYHYGPEVTSVVGSGTFSPCKGSDFVDLTSASFNGTTQVSIVDSFGRSSARVSLKETPTEAELSFISSTTGDFQLRCDWKPGTTATCSESLNLAPGSFNTVYGAGPCEPDGTYYVSIASENYSSYDAAFYRYEVQIEPPVPICTPDSYQYTAGVPVCYDVTVNDTGCPPGCRYELVTPTGLFPEAFQFYSDGTFTCTPPAGFSPITFTYRAVLGNKVSPAVLVQMNAFAGALSNPPVFIGPGGIPWVQAQTLVLFDVDYPMYQFFPANFPGDLGCLVIHWHTGSSGTPRPLNPPPGFPASLNPYFDPAPGACGYGKVEMVPQRFVALPLTEWQAFLNPPP